MRKTHDRLRACELALVDRQFILQCTIQETLKTERKRKETEMTTAYAAKSRPDFLLSGAEHTAGTLAEGLRASWQNYRAYRATLAELQALNDRQLADFGMRRDGVRAAARRAAYGN